MLRALRRVWDSYVAGIPKTEVVDSVPESQWDRADLLPAVSKARRKAFADLLALIHAHRPPDEAQALVAQGAVALTRSDEVDTALRAALLPESIDGTRHNPGFIACDWRASDEVQWQADRLCEAHHLSGHWSAPAGSMPEVLQDLDAWLQRQGHRLLCVADGDSVVAFAVRIEQADAAIARGKKLKLVLRPPAQL